MQELKALTVELVEENVALQIENDNFKALMHQEEEENIETPIEETRNATSQPTKNNYKVGNILPNCIMKVFIFVMMYLESIATARIVCFV